MMEGHCKICYLGQQGSYLGHSFVESNQICQKHVLLAHAAVCLLRLSLSTWSYVSHITGCISNLFLL